MADEADLPSGKADGRGGAAPSRRRSVEDWVKLIGLLGGAFSSVAAIAIKGKDWFFPPQSAVHLLSDPTPICYEDKCTVWIENKGNAAGDAPTELRERKVILNSNGTVAEADSDALFGGYSLTLKSSDKTTLAPAQKLQVTYATPDQYHTLRDGGNEQCRHELTAGGMPSVFAGCTLQ